MYLSRIETEKSLHGKVPQFTRERGRSQRVIPEPQIQTSVRNK